MLPAICWLIKALRTIFALIRFHSRVYKFMSLTIYCSCKVLFAILALIRFDSSVYKFMLLAMWWAAEAFITMLALVRSYSCMHQFMPLAIWQLTETLITVLALVRFYSCVSKFMPLTIRWSFKAQYLHWWGFTPVWITSRRLRCDGYAYWHLPTVVSLPKVPWFVELTVRCCLLIFRSSMVSMRYVHVHLFCKVQWLWFYRLDLLKNTKKD